MNIEEALALAGQDERVRDTIFAALLEAERNSTDPAAFRDQVRWPIVASMLNRAGTHRLTLESGLVFEVTPDSRIERAFLLSTEARPDHVWEPQTTKLLVALAAESAHAIVGGAYIGDQVLPMARAMLASHGNGVVHAFEPMRSAFLRLVRHLELNGLTNVRAHRAGLWDRGGIALSLEGEAALATSQPLEQSPEMASEVVHSVTIDDYAESNRLDSIGLIMLDTEGGEHKALLGATKLLSRRFPDAPHLVFEVHRSYVDWSNGLENTPIVKLLTNLGYTIFAIRDYQDNHNMRNEPIEVIPVDRVYLEGPPHGFNLLATKDDTLCARLALRVVENVSPKLLLHRDPALHQPLRPDTKPGF